jgi:Fe-S oxidoreductase
MPIKTVAELAAEGKKPEILFWVGCAGSFDDKAKKISRALASLLEAAGIQAAILGMEESCTGDPARRAGNEFLFQMMALQNIQTLNQYGIEKIVTACPHCFNTLKNEYPALGGTYEVYHHSQLLRKLLDEGRIKVREEPFLNKKVTFHDPCYLGRANGEYEAPRAVIRKIFKEIEEMERHGRRALCCGAGGAQMFKEAEKGHKEVNIERTEDALKVQPDIIATGCPFCKTMMADGVKHFEKEDSVRVADLAELLAESLEKS